MMAELIARNLLHRPLRTFIGVAAVAVEIALVVLVVGLTSGMLAEVAKRLEGTGADIMVQQPAAPSIITLGGGGMPVKIGAKLAELKYVRATAPALLKVSSAGAVEALWGIDSQSFGAVSGGFVFLQGGDTQNADDIIVDDLAAKAKHLSVGSTYRVLNHDWRVVGIFEHGKGSRLFVPLATMQDLTGEHDTASIFLLKCTRSEHTDDVMEEARHLLPGYTIRPLSAFDSLMSSANIPGLATFVNAMIALAVAIGLLVIFLTMYTTVLERTRDIGVLKSLGAGRVFIVRALLSESAGLCAVGIAAGIGLSYAVRSAFLAAFPTLSIQITLEWVLRAAGIALCGAVLGASYPAWLASRKDAVEALSYD